MFNNSENNKPKEVYNKMDYVLTEYIPDVFYIGKLIDKVDSQWKIQYYRKCEVFGKLGGSKYVCFKLPDVPDIACSRKYHYF